MANVRDYLKSKKNRKTGESNINYKEKIRSHRLSVFYKVLLSVALLTAIGAAIFVQWQTREFTESVEISAITIQKVEGAVSRQLGKSILTYSKDGANCIDAKGNVVWNVTYEMQNPLVEINESVAAIGDYNGRVIRVMNETGGLGEITTNMPIRKFSVSAKGIVAVILDDASVTRISLYDAKGNALVNFKTTMNDFGYPVDISLSPNGILCAVSYFYVDSGSMKTSVAFYNFGAVGQNETDNFVSGYDYQNTVVPYLRFMNSNIAFGVSDDRIMFFTGDQKPLSAAELLLGEEVQSVFHNSQYVGLVFMNTQGDDKYRLDVYNTSGILVGSMPFAMEFKDIVFYGDSIIIYGENEYSIYSTKGIQRFADRYDGGIYLMLQGDKANRYMIMSKESLNIIEIK